MPVAFSSLRAGGRGRQREAMFRANRQLLRTTNHAQSSASPTRLPCRRDGRMAVGRCGYAVRGCRGRAARDGHCLRRGGTHARKTAIWKPRIDWCDENATLGRRTPPRYRLGIRRHRRGIDRFTNPHRANHPAAARAAGTSVSGSGTQALGGVIACGGSRLLQRR